MSSEFESLKQHITKLKAKNNKFEAENITFKKENTVIPDLKNKLSIFDVIMISYLSQ